MLKFLTKKGALAMLGVRKDFGVHGIPTKDSASGNVQKLPCRVWLAPTSGILSLT